MGQRVHHGNDVVAAADEGAAREMLQVQLLVIQHLAHFRIRGQQDLEAAVELKTVVRFDENHITKALLLSGKAENPRSILESDTLNQRDEERQATYQFQLMNRISILIYDRPETLKNPGLRSLCSSERDRFIR